MLEGIREAFTNFVVNVSKDQEIVSVAILSGFLLILLYSYLIFTRDSKIKKQESSLYMLKRENSVVKQDLYAADLENETLLADKLLLDSKVTALSSDIERVKSLKFDKIFAELKELLGKAKPLKGEEKIEVEK